MAACENHDVTDASRQRQRPTQFLSRSALVDRLEEEINRATRHSTAFCCLLLGLDDLEIIERTHGKDISEDLLNYASATLRSEFRRFDRLGDAGDGRFMVLLPGADALRSEIVARRVLSRLRAIKIEVDERREPMRVSISLVTWRVGQTAEELMSQARAATAEEQLGFLDAVRI
jgi:diguanylate cyclase (GGDEF)-like protein